MTPAARDAGVGALVDMIALALTWVPMGELRVKAGIALSTLAAAAQPAVVDAETLAVEEWISDALRLRDRASGQDRDVLTRTAERLRILATAARPARAVPSREAVEAAISAHAARINLYHLIDGGPEQDRAECRIADARAALLALIYGDDPADASEAVRDV